MLKKIKTVAAVLACGALISSCTLAHSAVVTNNPVGSKTGKSQSKPFSKTTGVSYKNAMKDGGISTVGIGEYKMVNVIIGVKQTLIVTGE